MRQIAFPAFGILRATCILSLWRMAQASITLCYVPFRAQILHLSTNQVPILVCLVKGIGLVRLEMGRHMPLL